jgi:hypothetical protein
MPTTTRQITKTDWGGYFDAMSSRLRSTRVDILCESLAIGVQPAAEQIRLLGITYDRSDDAIEIATDGLEHRIQHPTKVYVQEDARGSLVSCLIGDSDGLEHIIELKPGLTA